MSYLFSVVYRRQRGFVLLWLMAIAAAIAVSVAAAVRALLLEQRVNALLDSSSAQFYRAEAQLLRCEQRLFDSSWPDNMTEISTLTLLPEGLAEQAEHLFDRYATATFYYVKLPPLVAGVEQNPQGAADCVLVLLVADSLTGNPLARHALYRIVVSLAEHGRVHFIESLLLVSATENPFSEVAPQSLPQWHRVARLRWRKWG